MGRIWIGFGLVGLGQIRGRTLCRIGSVQTQQSNQSDPQSNPSDPTVQPVRLHSSGKCHLFIHIIMVLITLSLLFLQHLSFPRTWNFLTWRFSNIEFLHVEFSFYLEFSHMEFDPESPTSTFSNTEFTVSPTASFPLTWSFLL